MLNTYRKTLLLALITFLRKITYSAEICGETSILIKNSKIKQNDDDKFSIYSQSPQENPFFTPEIELFRPEFTRKNDGKEM